ncbi:hypothetical protein ABIA00_004570 [Bradyrhizobium ottawaense]|uniref:hypothetical protein n=1 Tax=Bradyrhizobium ottawaense TaxID=931866 RepID=UPI003838D2D3
MVKFVKRVATPRPTALAEAPSLNTADVTLMLRPESWANPHNEEIDRLRACVHVAMAASARVGASAARAITVDAWRAGEVEVLGASMYMRKPVWLPVVVDAVETYRNALPKSLKTGPLLIVSNRGRQIPANNVWSLYRTFGRRHGFDGGELQTRLFQYFDRQLDREEEERATVAALAGCRVGADNEYNLPWVEVRRAELDRDLMQRILEDRHDLAGATERVLGAQALGKAEAERTFFPVKSLPTSTSAILDHDPVCVLLRDTAWTDRQTAQRNRLKRAHLEHLMSLRDQKLLRSNDIAYLLHVRTTTVEVWVAERRLRMRTPEQVETERYWKETLPGLFLSRPRMERPKEFYARIAADKRLKFPMTFKWMINTLSQAKAFGPRRRRRAASAA